MTISVAIMAHPARKRFVPPLLDALDCDAEVVWDRCNDRWDTGRRAMLAFDPSATHHMVIQDDAVLCADLSAGVERALKFTPVLCALGLYVGRVRPFAGRITALVEEAGEASWLKMTDLHWGVGVVVPAAVVPEMIEWCDAHPVENYDRRLSRFFVRRRMPVYYPWPSLVDHRDSPSLVAGRGGRRHAYRFVGAGRSALDLDWSGRVAKLTLPPGKENRPGARRLYQHVDGRRRLVTVGSPQERHLQKYPDTWQEVIRGAETADNR